ncbi:MAG: hypothetical protein AAB974_01310 [Patescibacteria group bacterium]
MTSLPEFPRRTVAAVGALALVFLVGAAAVRRQEQPAVSDRAVEAIAALEAGLVFTGTRYDVVVAQLRAAEDVSQSIAGLRADADSLNAAAAAVTASLSGVRGAGKDEARAGAERAVQAAVAVRTSAQVLAKYAEGGAPAADAVASIQTALSEIGAARSHIAPLRMQ